MPRRFAATAAAWRRFAEFRGELIVEYRGWVAEICGRCLMLAVRRFRVALRREVTREEPFDERAVDRGRQRPWRDLCESHALRLSEIDPADEVARLMAGLPARARRIVWWHACDHRSFCEIARLLRSSTRTVRRDWHRAKQAMLRRRASP